MKSKLLFLALALVLCGCPAPQTSPRNLVPASAPEGAAAGSRVNSLELLNDGSVRFTVQGIEGAKYLVPRPVRNDLTVTADGQAVTLRELVNWYGSAKKPVTVTFRTNALEFGRIPYAEFRSSK